MKICLPAIFVTKGAAFWPPKEPNSTDSLWQSLWVWRTSGWLKLLRSWEGQKLIIFTSVASVIIHHIHHIHHEKTFLSTHFLWFFFPHKYHQLQNWKLNLPIPRIPLEIPLETWHFPHFPSELWEVREVRRLGSPLVKMMQRAWTCWRRSWSGGSMGSMGSMAAVWKGEFRNSKKWSM